MVGLKQPKVAVSVWLYTIQCFKQCEGIFSFAILDQHLAAYGLCNKIYNIYLYI